MKKYHYLTSLILLLLILVGCKTEENNKADLINDPFTNFQDEIREVLYSIVKDAETANIEGLKAAHLNSDKFTKFGPRNFNRQNLSSTNESEEAFFSSVLNYKQEIRDLKIDVLGDVAIATYYPYVSFIQDGQEKFGSGRQTFVFLKTNEGWKIVHEHGTPYK